MEQKGLLIVFTGDGKGKTSAALGLAIRALGHGMRVGMVQFIKDPRLKSGEQEAMSLFGDKFSLHTMGKGFVYDEENDRVHRENALAAWQFASEQILSGRYELIILDEISYLFSLGFLPVETVWHVLEKRSVSLHVCMTGRLIPDFFLQKADLVTEMIEKKHPYNEGLRNIKGIDY
jgi:cob(I)alamin adenosyltransferase